MEHESSLPCTQDPANGPYPETNPNDTSPTRFWKGGGGGRQSCPCANEVQRNEDASDDELGSGSIAPRILNLSTRWR